MVAGRAHRGCIGLLLAMLMLVTAPAASAIAAAKVRFVNARGGSGSVTLQVKAGGKTVSVGGATAFGASSAQASVPAGNVKLTLSGAKQPAGTSASFDNGSSYTVLAIPKGSKGFDLGVLKNGKARNGKARLRVYHAAPELGQPDIRLGHRTIAQDVKFRSGSPYLTVDPGSYRLSVAKPN